MNSVEIREKFFSFFRDRGHYKVISSPLVPAKDPTLLFTNAGMNQFKDVFLGNEKRDYTRAVSIQKCMRVSGKHNDFDEVGRTEYHHTFFEMLGNFSFGDYFKEKSIEYAWELITEVFGFSPEDLRISVFNEDDEAHGIWEKRIGVSSDRISRLGEKDNFWQMGETGPCGPCSEIHFDRGEKFGPDEFSGENKRFVEIWNLVFMQYYKDEKGNMAPLPSPSIDTGMGMERLTTLLSGKSSNYETDLFRPIIEFTADMAGVNPDDNSVKVDLNVIADHVRALSFLISDGVLPANDGRGYILRRLLRRASKHGRSIGLNKSFLYNVVPVVIKTMDYAYPDLASNGGFISEVIESEEERFEKTLLSGLKKFEEVIQNTIERGNDTISGKEVFKLSDTYGFPIDFSIDLANEKNLKIDIEGFRNELSHQRKKSRKGSLKKDTINISDRLNSIKTNFSGYGNLEDESYVLDIFRNNIEVDALLEGEEGVVFLKKTPFYAESGGQTGDTGSGRSEDSIFFVTNTKKNSSGGHLHFVKVQKGKLSKGDVVNMKVDEVIRNNTSVHHTVTHLLHAALREVLGSHIKQSGSYVGPDKLRFDFTHFKSVNKEQLRKVENLVNNKIREDLEVKTVETTYEDAVSRGAIAIFDEKYSDKVRMLVIGEFSRELCGGTHLLRTGSIGCFKITSESSISSGIRRIEGVAGLIGMEYLNVVFDGIGEIESYFNRKGENLFNYLRDLEEKNRKLEKRIRDIDGKKKVDISVITDEIVNVNGVSTIVYHADETDRKLLSTTADEILRKHECVVVLSSNDDDKSMIVVSVHKNLTKKVNAGTLIKQISSLVNGKGGGRVNFAQAGGMAIKDPVGFRIRVIELLEKFL